MHLSLIQFLFLPAPLLIVPLGFLLIARPDRYGRLPVTYRLARWLMAPAAILAAASFYTDGLLTIPWLVFGLLCGCYGLARLLPRGFKHPEELAIDAGLLFLPVGCTWLTLSALEVRPLGFSEEIVMLTAVHFHYAGFTAMVIMGMTGRVLPLPRFCLWGAIAGISLLALGIAFSPVLEIAAAVLLAAALLWVAWLQVLTSRRLLALAGLSLGVGMVLAGVYAAGEFLERPLLTIPQMVISHGVFNALGFGLLGTIGWFALHPKSRRPEAGIPFSRLPGTLRIGAGYFERVNAVRAEHQPAGLVDSLDEYARPDFDTGAVAPAIRAFYERTAEHALTVIPCWRPGFWLGGRVFRFFANLAGQLCLPTGVQAGETQVGSRILAVDDAVDGRTRVRGWVRTYAGTGRAIYVAAYSTHCYRDVTYMNIAFPLPRGSLASILRLDSIPGGGVLLTTLHAEKTDGDQGVFYANRLLPIRLPMNETIRVWTEDGKVAARHDMWLFGIRFLTLEYAITPAPGCRIS